MYLLNLFCDVIAVLIIVYLLLVLFPILFFRYGSNPMQLSASELYPHSVCYYALALQR